MLNRVTFWQCQGAHPVRRNDPMVQGAGVCDHARLRLADGCDAASATCHHPTSHRATRGLYLHLFGKIKCGRVHLWPGLIEGTPRHGLVCFFGLIVIAIGLESLFKVKHASLETLWDIFMAHFTGNPLEIFLTCRARNPTTWHKAHWHRTCHIHHSKIGKFSAQTNCFWKIQHANQLFLDSSSWISTFWTSTFSTQTVHISHQCNNWCTVHLQLMQQLHIASATNCR